MIARTSVCNSFRAAEAGKKRDNENTGSNVTKRLLLSEAAAACSLALLETSKGLLEFQYAPTSGLKSHSDCPPTQSSLSTSLHAQDSTKRWLEVKESCQDVEWSTKAIKGAELRNSNHLFSGVCCYCCTCLFCSLTC